MSKETKKEKEKLLLLLLTHRKWTPKRWRHGPELKGEGGKK